MHWVLVSGLFWGGCELPQSFPTANFNCIASCVLLCSASSCLTPSYLYPALSDCCILAQRSKKKKKKKVHVPKNGKQRGQGLKPAWNQLPSCPAGGKEWVSYGYWCLITAENDCQFCCLIKCKHLYKSTMGHCCKCNFSISRYFTSVSYLAFLTMSFYSGKEETI